MLNKFSQKYIIIGVAVVILVGVFGFMYDSKVDIQGKLPETVKEFTIVRDNVPEEELAKLQRQFDEQLQKLSELTPDSSEWNTTVQQIGILKFAAQDYDGAREAWEYVYERDSKNYIINGNLANVNFYYLKDYEKAEKHYLEALEVGVGAPVSEYTFFTGLLDLYQYGTEDRQKADALVERALSEISFDYFKRMQSRAADYYEAIGEEEKLERVLSFTREAPVSNVEVVTDEVPE